jgi:hypothetical protein
MQGAAMSADNRTHLIQRILAVLTWGAWVIAIVTVLFAVFSNGEEVRGNLAFAFLVASVLVALTMIPALMIGVRARNASRICWIALSVAIVLFTGYIASLDHPDARQDAGTVFVIAMTVLTFPLGLVVLALSATVSRLLPESSLQLQLLLAWALFLGAGYLQWWRIVPALLRKFVSRGNRHADAVSPGNAP